MYVVSFGFVEKTITHRNKQKANLYLAMSSMKTVFFVYKVFFGKLTNFQVHMARTCIYFFLYSLFLLE